MNDSRKVGELLATLLDGARARTRARHLLRITGGPGALASRPTAWLERVGGLSSRESERVVAGLQLGLRALTARPQQPRCCPEDVVSAIAPMIRRDVEEVWALTVGPGLRPMHAHLVARGGVDACSVAPATLLRRALLDGATGLFVVHNHPSGDVEPSPEDLGFTLRLKRASDVVGITLHDHLVVSGGRWASCLYPGSGSRA